jgi:hypothetical protein
MKLHWRYQKPSEERVSRRKEAARKGQEGGQEEAGTRELRLQVLAHPAISGGNSIRFTLT